MNSSQKVAEVSVRGLQGVFNYDLTFPPGADTVILIAPNGYGKTALLSLLRDCIGLKLRKAAQHTFDTLAITFDDGSKWHFRREDGSAQIDSRLLRQREAEDAWYRTAPRWGETRRSPSNVIFTRFDSTGAEIAETIPEFDESKTQLYMRALDRLSHINILGSGRIRDVRSNEYITLRDAYQRYFLEIVSSPATRDLLSSTDPDLVWNNIGPIDCVFIETQRLLYSKDSTADDAKKDTPQEEILRQAQHLSTLLQSNYSDYAAKSQQLDRSFPSRLISRARKIADVNPEAIKAGLEEVEDRRRALTEAGILVEQAEALISTDDEVLPAVAEALQIYVEDSRDKLGTYDEVFPKISVFRDLMSKKLFPKKLSIGRDIGASISRDGVPLKLQGLSSGEKHEFIMLFKLIFETPQSSLVLIDEPEISLHVVWQLEFMSDLRRIQSANPFQSIIATHSPQIFQGFQHLLIDLADQAQ